GASKGQRRQALRVAIAKTKSGRTKKRARGLLKGIK
ncbi:unnamed protein product, partial [marine sediment metagenome]